MSFCHVKGQLRTGKYLTKASIVIQINTQRETADSRLNPLRLIPAKQ